MIDEINKSRSHYQKKISSIFLIISFIVSALLSRWINPIKSLSTLVEDLPTIYHLFVILSCSFYVLFGVLSFSSLLVYWEESEDKNLPVLSSRIVKYLDFRAGCSLIVVSIALLNCKTNAVSDGIQSLLMLTVIALCFAFIYNLMFDYDDVDFANSQNCETSIGALWAVGAYKSYYELTLEDIIQKIQTYEKENDVYIPVKKLFVICPLSCNVNGSLNKKDDRIFKDGLLEVLECDQGANANRRYKHTVYKIQENEFDHRYIVAEYASPLGTLWEDRFSMNENKWKYHRDCLVKNLKDLLKDYACTVLEYDDQNPSTTEPLYRFLLASIEKEIQDKNIWMKENLNIL